MFAQWEVVQFAAAAGPAAASSHTQTNTAAIAAVAIRDRTPPDAPTFYSARRTIPIGWRPAQVTGPTKSVRE